jgi:protein SCO1/2
MTQVAEVAPVVDAATATAASRDALLRLLREQSDVYDGKSEREAVRIRGYILAAFERIGLPDSALPHVLEELQNGRDPYLVAAAAKAIRGAKRPPNAMPHLKVASERIAPLDAPVSFESFDPSWPYLHPTTAKKEITATIEWIGSSAAPREVDGCCEATARPAEPLRDVTLEDQGGSEVAFDDYFRGKPSVVVFFYTRCDNPAKCSLSIATLARLQNELERRGMAGNVRLAAITYDPSFDLPARMKGFGEFRGIRFNDDMRFFRAVDHTDQLRAWFDLGVNYAGAIVNRHRIEAYVLDRRGRIVTSFVRLQWTPEAILSVVEPMVRRRFLTSTIHSMAAVLLALIPKCPLCVAAYLSAFGAGTLRLIPSRPLVLLTAGLFLAIHFATVLRRSRQTGAMAAIPISAAGAVLLMTSFFVNSSITGIAGALLLAAGAFASVSGSVIARVGTVAALDHRRLLTVRVRRAVRGGFSREPRHPRSWRDGAARGRLFL